MKCGSRVAMAVAGGYLLGRSRKMKWALTLGAMMAGKRFSGAPSGLLQQGTQALRSSPEVSRLTEDIRGRLVEVGKTAAMAAVSSRIDSFSDMLHERAETLRRPTPPGRPGEPEEAPRGEEPGEEEPEGRGGRRGTRPRRERPDEDLEDEDLGDEDRENEDRDARSARRRPERPRTQQSGSGAGRSRR